MFQRNNINNHNHNDHMISDVASNHSGTSASSAQKRLSVWKGPIAARPIGFISH